MKTICLLLLICCLGCHHATEEKSTEMTENQSVKTTSSNQNHSVKAQKFPEADITLHRFFTNLTQIEDFINPTSGVYCIENGQGANPIIEKLNDKNELLGKTPFLFMYRDAAFIKNNVLVNPPNFDICSCEEDGYFIFELTKPQSVLNDIYDTYQNQQAELPNNITPNELKKIDHLLYKSVVVNFKSKYGEQVLLKLYFCIQNDQLYLSIIDLRDCAA